MIKNSDVFLPVTFNRLSKWPGHSSGTRTRLLGILDAAARRPGGLSLAERALLAVCEFWSAVATRSLEWHLGANPEQRLRSVAMVYTAMGAKRAARAMECTLSELVRTHNDDQRQQRIAALEQVMLRARGTVDEMIGRFAMRLQPAAREAARRPADVAVVATAAAAAAVVVVARRPAVATVRRPVTRSYVRWRTENQGAEQHD